MTTLHAQLPLVFETRNSYSFETMVAGDNELAIGIIRQSVQASGTDRGEKQVYVWSAETSGKSHLMQAACQAASNHDRSVCYLPAKELRQYEADVLEGMEALDLLCIDDVDALFGIASWEEALFDLINRCRESSCCLLLSAEAPPDDGVGLADLRSRLQWGPVFQLKVLDDEKKIVALQLRANQRGLTLQENVAEYMLNHYQRDLATLFERFDDLDKASLAQQRKLTIPFIKSVLDQSDSD